jgi:hypothetical protein
VLRRDLGGKEAHMYIPMVGSGQLDVFWMRDRLARGMAQGKTRCIATSV